jgi:hypothetical protein
MNRFTAEQTAAALDTIRADLATHFETLPDLHLAESGRQAVLEAGGVLVEPPPRLARWGTDISVTLHGVTGTGETLVEALRAWTRRALRIHRHWEDAA